MLSNFILFGSIVRLSDYSANTLIELAQKGGGVVMSRLRNMETTGRFLCRHQRIVVGKINMSGWGHWCFINTYLMNAQISDA